MEANALHYTPTELESKDHPYKLVRSNDITLRLNYAQMGVGGITSWGYRPLNKYQLFPDHDYTYSYRLTPITASSVPMTIKKQNFPEPVTPPLGSTQGTNIALNKTASADSQQAANTAAMANDGNIATRWCASDSGLNHWWKVDLGQNYNISGSQVMWELNGKVYKYKVEVSTDNTNWTTKIDKTNNTSTQQTQSDNFTAIARYVRITVTGLDAAVWASMNEFRVFGSMWFDPAGYYRIINRNSGKCIDVTGSSTADGAQIVQWTYNGGNNQQWQIIDVGGGYFRITNRNSGKSLDVNAQSTEDGAQLIQWPYGGGNNQQWQLVDVGGGYYEIVCKNSSKCADVTGASTADGAQIIQWTYAGGNNQQWQIIKMP
jgi:alpha-L-fucosidase